MGAKTRLQQFVRYQVQAIMIMNTSLVDGSLFYSHSNEIRFSASKVDGFEPKMLSVI